MLFGLAIHHLPIYTLIAKKHTSVRFVDVSDIALTRVHLHDRVRLAYRAVDGLHA